MAKPEHVLRGKLAAVFARPDFYDACLRRDAGAMITILNAGGVTQGQIAGLTGLAQSTLSNYKRGVNTAQFTTTFEKLADGLDMPPPLRQALGLTGEATPAGSRSAAGALAGLPADTFDLQLLAEAGGKERNGRETPRPARAGGAARRDAVLGLVKVAALEGAGAGLTANAVAPGWMRTPLAENQIRDHMRLRGISRDDVIASMTAEQPADRFVETTEVAGLITFLAGAGGAAINGACIPVDTGTLAG